MYEAAMLIIALLGLAIRFAVYLDTRKRNRK
jgi:hypothetical protein